MTTPSSSPAADRLIQLESYLRQDPDNAGLLQEAFGAALEAGLVDAAEFHLVHASRLGHDAWVWGLNGVHLDLARHRWDAAARLASELRNAPGRPEAMLDALDHALAYAEFRQGNWAAASETLEPLLARAAASGAPVAAASQALALRIWHRCAQLDRALAWARTRFDDGSLQPEAAGVASLIALDAGDFEASHRWAGFSLTSGAVCAEALVAAASLATASRDAVNGQRFARQALSLNADDGRSLSALGMAQMLAGALPDARNSFEAAVRTMPDHVGTWLALGWSLLLMNDLNAALSAFEQAVALDRNFGEAHGGLAAVQAKLGQRDEALASIERARRLDATGLSFRYAQQVLDGGDLQGVHGLLPLARRLLGERQAPLGGTMADWLPPEDPVSR